MSEKSLKTYLAQKHQIDESDPEIAAFVEVISRAAYCHEDKIDKFMRLTKEAIRLGVKAGFARNQFEVYQLIERFCNHD